MTRARDTASIIGSGVTSLGEIAAASLDISGNADVDGTTNLDAVDIDGAVQLDSTLTVGANDQGYDVTLHGDTASRNVVWDSSADSLKFSDGAKAVFGNSSNLQIYHSGGYTNIIENGTGNLDIWGDNIVFYNSAGSKIYATFVTDGAVSLYHNNAVKIATTAAGATVTGAATVSGDVLCGCTSLPSASVKGFGIDVKSTVSMIITATSSTSADSHHRFFNPNGDVGGIHTSGSATVYATSSDYRLKENVVYDWDATTRLKQLKPARFNFIADADTTVDGFLAHEAQAVVPESVTGTKDEVDDNGDAVMQGIDQSKILPLLVKTILELEARITALEKT